MLEKNKSSCSVGMEPSTLGSELIPGSVAAFTIACEGVSDTWFGSFVSYLLLFVFYVKFGVFLRRTHAKMTKTSSSDSNCCVIDDP